MAIKLIANYSKRLGLPGFSSHQFSVSVETELVTTDDVAAESARLYQKLQSSVDEQMLQPGFVPSGGYGMEPEAGSAHESVGNVTPMPSNGAWKCSEKQKKLILTLVEEHQLDKNAVEALAQERFGKGVRQLNKVEASGLIDELLETHGGNQAGQSNRGRSGAYRRTGGRDAA